MRENTWFKLFLSDLLADTARLSPASFGIFMRLLFWMHQHRTETAGVFIGSIDALARLCSATPEQVNDFLREVELDGILTCTNEHTKCNENVTVTPRYKNVTGNVTLTNRRIAREQKDNAGAALRMKRHRTKAHCYGNVTGDVTDIASASASSSISLSASASKEDIPPTASAVAPKGARRAARFVQPSLTELADYLTERQWHNPGIMASKFIDHYTARGWRIGKANTPMKDWRAAVRTWESNGDGVQYASEAEQISNELATAPWTPPDDPDLILPTEPPATLPHPPAPRNDQPAAIPFDAANPPSAQLRNALGRPAADPAPAAPTPATLSPHDMAVLEAAKRQPNKSAGGAGETVAVRARGRNCEPLPGPTCSPTP